MPYYIQSGNHIHYDTNKVSKKKRTAYIQDNKNKVTVGRRCLIVSGDVKRIYEIYLTLAEYRAYRITGAIPTRLEVNELRFLTNNVTPLEFSTNKSSNKRSSN